MSEIRWLSLFADVPADNVDAARTFWAAVAGARPGEPSGAEGEYLPLDPPDGDRYLWLQRIGSDTPGWHLDLHVADVTLAAATAAEAGAQSVRRVDQLVTLRSPAGQPFCFIAEEDGRPRRHPAPAAWPRGRSRVDQICLDIPDVVFDAECAFWERLTGWPRHGVSGDADEFDRLAVPAELPVRVLLQRLGADDEDGIRAHADLAADVRAAEVDRHVALGAEVQQVAAQWTTLRDPAGLVYCVTDRKPR